MGQGVLIDMMGDYEGTIKALAEAENQTIKELRFEYPDPDNQIIVEFESGDVLTIWDNGQSCCESRYITTSDDLFFAAGAKFLGVEMAPALAVEDQNYGLHETMFVHIMTDKRKFTFETHNEHNGYYGGFRLQAVFRAK